MARRGSIAVGFVLAAAWLAACEPEIDRADADLVRRATQRAFERAYAAEHRMRTGVVDPELLAYVEARCRPAAPRPAADRDWPWTCRVRYAERSGARGEASYRLLVDPRGCFTAASAGFPPRVQERILARPARNPLALFRSCP